MIEVMGVEVEIDVPESAVVGSVIVMVEYQVICENGHVHKNFAWGTNTSLSDVNMLRLTDLCKMSMQNQILDGWEKQ